MGKFFSIFIGLFIFVSFQSKAQVLSKQDSIQYKIEQRRIVDSTRIALKTIVMKKRQDSLAQAIKIRQIERKRIADSMRIVKKKQRDALKKQNKEFTQRKKDRERIRDSVARASEKAALARKAYKKSLKKQNKKDELTKIAKAKADKLKKEEQAKIAEEKEKARKEKEAIANREKKIQEDKAKAEKQKKAEQVKTALEKEKKKKEELAKKQKERLEQEEKIAKEKEAVTKEKAAKTKDKVAKKQTRKEKAKAEQQKKEAEAKIAQSKKSELKQAEETKKSNKKLLVKEKKKTSDGLESEAKIARKKKKEKVTSNPNLFTPEIPVHFKYGKNERVIEPPVKKENFFAFQIGSSNYLGDLGGNSNLQNNLLGNVNFKDNNFFYGFSFSQLRREAVGIRLSYVFGEISGSDKNTYFTKPSDPSYLRFIRNLDFKTKINEGSLMFELHPFKFLSHKTKLHNSFFQPYGLIGLGRFSFNPQGSYFDTDVDALFWYDLQPLSLEGQGMSEFPDREPYALTQWNVPYGLGFKYEISPTISLGLEYVGRILFTDYLDDVSTRFIDPDLFQNYFNAEDAALAANLSNKSKLVNADRAYKPGQGRGNPNNNDFYFSLSARLIIKISKNKKKLSIMKPVYKYDDSEICE